MNEQTYAIIEAGVVTNVIVWDGIQPYNPGEGRELVLLDGPGGIGWDYQDGQFVDNRPVEDPTE